MLRAAAPLALAALLAACDGPSGASCPGQRVAALHFTGTRVARGDGGIAGLDPAEALPDCAPDVGYPAVGEPLPPFDAVLAQDPVTAAAAMCRGGGVVLYGERTGTRYTVETGTPGAVLGTCAATCTAALRLVIAGDVAGDASGAVIGFKGGLFETMSALEGSVCGACTLPCQARYTVSGD